MEKREEILRAAADCFSIFGYAKTSMSDIGKRVGMNKASLYYHFKDKLSIYEAVMEELMTEHRLKLKELVTKKCSLDDKLISLVIQEIDFWSDIAITHKYADSLEKKKETSQIVETSLAKNGQFSAEVIEQGIKEGKYKKCDPNEMSKLIRQVGQGLLLVNCPLELPNDEIVKGYKRAKVIIEEATRILIKGLYVDVK